MINGVRFGYNVYKLEEAILKDDRIYVDLDNTSINSKVSKLSRNSKIKPD